ncbi:MAG: HDOD domain-containing protein [Treponema sp.]|jgi:HD-like signal output (HDOD) protein|nr:HDOD domain-containing protein [Treponema sp.]
MDEALREKLAAYIKNMPSLPVTRPKVLELCNNPGASPADLKQIISLDPVLTGRTLNLVNTAYGGMEGRSVSIVRAVIMLGINTVKNLVLSAAGPEKGASGERLDYASYWRHSLRAGLAARRIARKRGIDPALLEEYFAAGLLHDVGKLPLSAALPGTYPLAVKASDSWNIPLFQGETENLGLNHNEAGELVVKAWKLEGALADAVIHHHNYREYPGKHRDLLYSVVAANYFASRTETAVSGAPCLQKPDDAVWETLGIPWEDLENWQPAVDEELQRARNFLGLEGPSC